MRHSVSNVLLVSSLYDSFIIEEDGTLYESIRREYETLSLAHVPELRHAPGGTEALQLLTAGHRFDLIIATLHIDDMHPARFAQSVRDAGITTPMVLLVYDNREQSEVTLPGKPGLFDRVFMWQGDYRILLAIVKDLEDRMNVEHDTRTMGVQSIILIEDNLRYYSSFLPLIYAEVLHHSQRLLAEGINRADRYLRMRARPKILFCTTFEEAWGHYENYADDILGVIADIDFPRGGTHDPRAGIEFAQRVKVRHPDIPILLQSTDADRERDAHAIGVSFLLKDSPTLLHDLRQFIVHYFAFGDFIFRTPDGQEVGRAIDLKSLEEQLAVVPEESIVHHAERNHFSRWLKARTEFVLAHLHRPRKVTDYASPAALRDHLMRSLHSYQRARQAGQVTDFSRSTFHPTNGFSRIGGGSLGGKARGLAFVNSLINAYDLGPRFEGVRIAVPPTVVLGTDVFDEFVAANDLKDFALRADDDRDITSRFVEARLFPEAARRQLSEFLDLVDAPLAVRSSTLLEDSQYHPFAGVYKTFMIPNRHPTPDLRLQELVTTIKRVYASTYHRSVKNYFRHTSYQLEEERMAVVVQKLVGCAHGSRYYPDFSGVARSHNFYPVGPQQPRDGTASVAMGLGKTIVDGGVASRFCPRYPLHGLSPSAINQASQRSFFALNLEGDPLRIIDDEDQSLDSFELDIAEADGTLKYVASTYSPADDTMYDGISRPGQRLITFAPILRNKILPLPEIVDMLLDLASWGMGTPIEMEFAVTMSVPAGQQREFGVLQIRPMVVNREAISLQLDDVQRSSLVCLSRRVLGTGVIGTIYDVVMVDRERFERSRSVEVAAAVSALNAVLSAEGRPYLLIGVGRWGSLDPWLGIPVQWVQIAGARVIIETGFRDFEVTPSEGSHFFQNITAFAVGYFTVSQDPLESFVDWEWLRRQQSVQEQGCVRHLRFSRPLVVKIDSEQGVGIILKP